MVGITTMNHNDGRSRNFAIPPDSNIPTKILPPDISIPKTQ